MDVTASGRLRIAGMRWIFPAPVMYLALSVDAQRLYDATPYGAGGTP
jgi:hypothetical protein